MCFPLIKFRHLLKFLEYLTSLYCKTIPRNNLEKEVSTERVINNKCSVKVNLIGQCVLREWMWMKRENINRMLESDMNLLVDKFFKEI